MAILDKILFWGIIIISSLSLSFSVLAVYKAFKSAKYDDEGLRMFLWMLGALIGLIIAGMGIAYILIPIIFHYSSNN